MLLVWPLPNRIATPRKMIRYYFLLFVRNVKRQKLFSIINLLGLTAGIVSTLLIYLYVQHELSYDRFHANADNIYRINQTFIWGEHDDNQFASLGPGVAYAIHTDVPEAKAVTRIHPAGEYLVTNAENKNNIKTFDQSEILAVDSNFFEVFTFPLLKGNPKTALEKPNYVVLSESTAKKYFGTEDALCKLLLFADKDRTYTYEVSGVAKDAPDNSYIQFDMLLPMITFPRILNSNDQWVWTTFETFVVIDEETSPEVLQAKLDPLPRRYAEATVQSAFGQTFDDYLKSGRKWELFVQPLTSIRLYSSDIYNRLNEVGNIKIVYILIGVEIFIILLSCINFMNLSTAQYTRRIKESSLRKILGSSKNQLAVHFFSEAFMFCLVAAIVGLGITQLVIPFFNILAGTSLAFTSGNTAEILFVLITLVIVMSVLSGSYPAIFLSKFSPAEAMKGKLNTGKQGKVLRNGLVGFQFFISMVLIVSTIVVFQQLQYLAQKDVGFNRENLMVIDRAEWINDEETFQQALESIAGVERASWCTAVPPNLFNGDSFKVEGESNSTTPLNFLHGDEEYAATLGLDIIVGRNFSKDIPGDKGRVILNESAVKAFGWPLDESIIGKKIEYPGDTTYEVIGMVRDFNYWALQSPIQPMAIFHAEGRMYNFGGYEMALRIKPTDSENLRNLIAEVSKTWTQFAGDRPFQYEFVDDSFDEAFRSEEKFSQGLFVFAGLAIMIACFGLLGMIIYTLEQRMKEIGVRKVVGASVTSIWLLIIRDYTYLISVAVVTSVPLCIWLLGKWLEDFTYRIELSPMAFIFAGAGILITSLLVTSYHVVRAAHTNPVDVLKDE